MMQLQGFKATGQSPFVIDKQLLQRERPGLLLTQVPACLAIAVMMSHWSNGLVTAGRLPQHVLLPAC
jgi:hypothetical protein